MDWNRNRRTRSLLWRVFTPNALILALVTVALGITPASVPSPLETSGAIVIVGMLSLLLVLNLILMRRAFEPLARLRAFMAGVDPLAPGRRVPVEGPDTEVVELASAFNEMLGRIEDERRTSAQRALLVQESERRRISGELHDEMGQELTGLLLELTVLASRVPANLRDDVLRCREAARDTLEHTRRVARELRPSALDDFGLLAALSTLCDRFSERTGVSILARLGSDLPPLSHDQELAIYRVAQESLTNVARHANADAVELLVRSENSHVSLCVSDNGVGDMSQAEPGQGLSGMRERALALGGKLAVERREEGPGLQVTLELPIGSTPP